MHLMQVKKNTGKSWGELSIASGIPKSNLITIANAKRGWDSATGAKLRLIGVDLNEQSALLAKSKGWRLPEKLAS